MSLNYLFASAGSAVEVAFNYRGLACIRKDFLRFEIAGVGSTVEVDFYYRRLAPVEAGWAKTRLAKWPCGWRVGWFGGPETLLGSPSRAQ